ncbi:Rid family detoxifying hydrolase [Senegalia sp. (in: firmicutes)]|uniref:Rid family detoxifying hydrolase n=1 Tax=Senegalia sp. (in: firmicutes) TaxID=1924098 RepID=UPI003F9D71FF
MKVLTIELSLKTREERRKKMNRVPQPIGPYSNKRNGNGLLFLSGQLPVDPTTGELVEDFEDACYRSLQNIENILKEDRLTIDSILKLTVLTTEIDKFDIINKVFKDFFGDIFPARSVFEVSRLPKNASIEIEAIVDFKN